MRHQFFTITLHMKNLITINFNKNGCGELIHLENLTKVLKSLKPHVQITS